MINKEDTQLQRRVEFGSNIADDAIGFKETGYNFAFSVASLYSDRLNEEPDTEL